MASGRHDGQHRCILNSTAVESPSLPTGDYDIESYLQDTELLSFSLQQFSEILAH